ncbi:MAG: CDP-alcohol phosphatidyltransferase family protein [Oscillospiraceae bacterium]|jgi:phosphatidylglycerophosphate synthase
MMTLNEVREKCLTKEKKAALKRDILCYYLVRPFCDMMTIPCVKLKISATAVTKVSIILIIASFILFVLSHNTLGFIISWILFFFWNILDNVDGNIARYTHTASPIGELWDAAGGYIAMFTFSLGMGISAFHDTNLLFQNLIPSYYYIIFGATSGFLLLFPRIILQKKNNLLGKESVESIKNKSNFGFVKTVALNISSINGLASFLFLAGILTHTLNILTVAYLLFDLLFAFISLMQLFKNPKVEQ